MLIVQPNSYIKQQLVSEISNQQIRSAWGGIQNHHGSNRFLINFVLVLTITESSSFQKFLQTRLISHSIIENVAILITKKN